MKIENQVCSLDQARELLELGVRCESYFGWIKSSNGKDWYISSDDIDFADYYAYTCAELGMMLPNICGSNRITFQLNIIKTDTGWLIWDDTCGHRSTKKTEAQARAAALIWLIKEGHIKAEEVKL